MLDVPEGVKLLWVTESFRQFSALVSLANIFPLERQKLRKCQVTLVHKD